MFRLSSLLILLYLNYSLSSPVRYEISEDDIPVEFKDYPFMVSIRYTTNGYHRCGGTILNPGWILTSAFCVANYSTTELFIEYGGTTSSPMERRNTTISEFIIHPEYNADARDFMNDIAIFKLESPIEISDFVRPVEIAPSNLFLPDYVQGITIGWKMTLEGKPKHHEIMRVETITDRDCDDYYIGGINVTNMCAENISNGGKFRIGDAGGALIIYNQQVGIISFIDEPDEFDQYPVGCTEITFYHDWIKDSVGQYLKYVFDNYRL